MGKLRDRFKRGGGGGFLNNVDGVIVGGGFTTNPGWDNKGGRLFARVDILQDGAAETVSTHLDAGMAEGLTITEDGYGVIESDDHSLWNGTQFTNFYNSLVDAGLEDVEELNFAHVFNNGIRAHFEQQKDEAKMERDAKNYKRSKGAINESGQRKGKDGKYYDQKTLVVSEIFSTGNKTPTPAVNLAPKTTKAAPAAKGAKATTPPAEDLTDFTKNVLIEVLEAANGKLSRTSLSTGVVKRFNKDDLKGDPRRDDVRKMITDEAFIAEACQEGLITFEKNILALA